LYIITRQRAYHHGAVVYVLSHTKIYKNPPSPP